MAIKGLKRFLLEAEEEHLLSQWVVAIMVMVHFGLGGAILVGGVERFQLPTYQPLIDISGGRVWLWGAAIILSGAMMAARDRWISIAGLWLGMTWMVMWASLFAVSVTSHAESAATPVVAYAGFAMINASLLTARALELRRPRQG